jgi:hypothetical protein
MGDIRFLPGKPKLLEYVARSEPWCVYELEDGSILKIRLMVVKIIETGQYDANGYHVYAINHQQVTDITWADSVEAEAKKRRGASNGQT